MQGMLHKKDTSHIIVCPRCGAENLTRQSTCGKCGFIFPKTEKDAAKNSLGGGMPARGSSIPGAPKGGIGGGAAGGMGAGGAVGAGAGSGMAGSPSSAGRSAIARGAGVPSTIGGTENGAGEAGATSEAQKPKSAHEKIETHTEGIISQRGEWLKCPRCEADVKADTVRCPRCGWKVGKK